MKQISGLYVITDEEVFPGRTHVEIAKAAIEGGAKLIQIRDKHISDRKFYEAALTIRKLCSDNDVVFFVNDRVHIAAAAGADGVNVGQTDLPVEAVRTILGPDAIIGQSCESVEMAVRAWKDGADYVGFGPIYTTSTKLDAGPASGIEILKQVCKAVPIPVVAIGGISMANIGEVASAGAHSAAVVSAVVCAKDMKAATNELIRRFGKQE